MNINLFKMALDKLKPHDWARFEQLASFFLATEFDNLRTMASPSGDGGRDSELFSAEDSPIVAMQYSVAYDWKTKIERTVDRLNESFPDVRIMFYMTNKIIGANADKLRAEMLRRNIHLDIRDRNWFIERANQNPTNKAAAELLINQIARPYLAGEQIIRTKSSSLTSEEAKVAFLYLGFQWQDDIQEKGLTKLSYDALVRAVLRNTDSEHRLSRTDIHNTIVAYLPNTNRKILENQTNSALKRLTKQSIRHWQKIDEFCLIYEESERLKERLAIREEDETMFLIELERQCVEQINILPNSSRPTLQDLMTRVQRVLDKFLLERGEAFASAVASEHLTDIGFERLPDIIIRDIDRYRPDAHQVSQLPNVVNSVINRLVADAAPATQKHLRCLSDSYTLFAFLCEVPDVQRATRKMFSHGEIWLDTTVVLPLFIEALLEQEKKRFTSIFRACTEAGMTLKITQGVVEEVYSHMGISETCSRHSVEAWRGRIPFLYYHYVESGRNPASFSQWLELFRGTERPQEDIADYLEQQFNIECGSLEQAVSELTEELRFAVQGLWLKAHEERRGKGTYDYDPSVTTYLVNHDVENYLGIIGLRKGENLSEFGYRQWWLTLDRIAWQIRDQIKEQFKDNTPSSPLIGLDFLINHLAFSPSRSQLSKKTEQSLPILFDFDVAEFLPKEMLEVAERIRQECKDLPEYVIHRRIRDACDKIRRQFGPLTHDGIHRQTLEA